MSEHQTYNRTGRYHNPASWWKHMRGFKREAHKKCRAAVRRIFLQRGEA